MVLSGSLLIRIGAEFVTTNKSRWQHDISNVETSNWFSVHLEYYGRTTVSFTDATHTSFNCTFISRTTFGGGRGGQGSESHSSVSINTHKTNSRRGYSYNVRSHNFYNFQIEILLVKICTLSSSLTAPAAWRILGVWIQTALRSGGYTELARADGDNRQEVILHLGILDLTFHETLLEVSGWLLSAQ